MWSPAGGPSSHWSENEWSASVGAATTALFTRSCYTCTIALRLSLEGRGHPIDTTALTGRSRMRSVPPWPASPLKPEECWCKCESIGLNFARGVCWQAGLICIRKSQLISQNPPTTTCKSTSGVMHTIRGACTSKLGGVAVPDAQSKTSRSHCTPQS